MSTPQPVCLKASELRKIGISDLKAYDADSMNVNVCRRGRVFVTRDSATSVYQYPASIWANPFVVGDTPGKYPLEESLRLYQSHLDALLRKPGMRAKFLALAFKRRIGCFCALGELCHRDVILQKLHFELTQEENQK
jgi:hypothetical protein